MRLLEERAKILDADFRLLALGFNRARASPIKLPEWGAVALQARLGMK
jgi:hypothetical protein